MSVLALCPTLDRGAERATLALPTFLVRPLVPQALPVFLPIGSVWRFWLPYLHLHGVSFPVIYLHYRYFTGRLPWKGGMTAPKIELIRTDKLIPYARNARTHSDEQVSQIAGSIKEFGFTNPVLIDSENGIIAGHGRVMAARVLGLAEVPCLRLAHLSETQRRAYILADNRIALNSGWDESMLALELTELQIDGVSLESLGFDSAEIDRLINQGDMFPESSAEEIDPDDFNLGTCCPKCGFEFDPALVKK